MGDVDGDGDLDIVFIRSGQNLLYINAGKGMFVSATAPLPGAGDTRSLTLADLDRDGDLDLVTMSDDGPGRRVNLYSNDGSGLFTEVPASINQRYGYPNEVALGDIDGDEDLDMVFAMVWKRSFILTNMHVQIDAPRFAIPSREFILDFYAKPGYGTSFHVAVPVLSPALAPTPLSVPPYGKFYLDPNGLIGLPWVAIPPWSGKGTLRFTVPDDPSLVGQTLYTQALIIELPWSGGSPPTGSHLTGYTKDVIIK